MVYEELQESEIASSEKLAPLKAQLEGVEKQQRRYFELIESEAIAIGDVAPRLKELSAAKEALLAEREKLETSSRQKPTVLPSPLPVKAFVEDLRATLREGSLMQQKAFLRAFIKQIGIRDQDAEIEYTCPIGLTGNRRNEVLSIGKIGSRGRTRTNFLSNSQENRTLCRPNPAALKLNRTYWNQLNPTRVVSVLVSVLPCQKVRRNRDPSAKFVLERRLRPAEMSKS
jgi:hypothetical protein